MTLVKLEGRGRFGKIVFHLWPWVLAVALVVGGSWGYALKVDRELADTVRAAAVLQEQHIAEHGRPFISRWDPEAHAALPDGVTAWTARPDTYCLLAKRQVMGWGWRTAGYHGEHGPVGDC